MTFNSHLVERQASKNGTTGTKTTRFLTGIGSFPISKEVRQA